YLARAESPTGGRDLNIHFGDLERGYLGQISHLGDMIPVMAGIALAFKLRREPRVGLVYIGDGGMSAGAFHEGINFAAARRVPLVVVGEYNHWAYSTPPRKQFAVEHLADRVKAYGIPAVSVDGNDVLAVYEATRFAVERARQGKGVHFIEVKTYRRKGHAEHDDQHYVPQHELEWWAKENDPIDRYVQRLLGSGWAEEQELKEIDERVRVEIDGGAFKVTEGFAKQFGEERVIDTPISEAAIVGAAAGAAHMGMRPVAEMQFIDFISCAYDMLTNYVATARYRAGLPTPMVVR